MRKIIGAFALSLAFGAACGERDTRQDPQVAVSSLAALVKSHVSDGSCSLTQTGDVVVQKLQVVDLCSPGNPDNCRLVLDATSEQNTTTGAFSSSWSLSWQNQPLVTSKITNAGSKSITDISIDFGKVANGMEQIRATSDGTTIQGTVDGKPFGPLPIPIDPSVATFTDGSLIPGGRLPPPFDAAVKLMADEVLAQEKTCSSGDGGTSASDTGMGGSVGKDHSPPKKGHDGPIALSSTGDPGSPGHQSDTTDAALCIGCRAACVVTTTGGAIACCLGSFFLGCGGCAAVAAAAQTGCIYEACKGTCCPKDCGSDNDVQLACCFSGETCLNADTSMCCSSNETACAGTRCCPGGDTCIATGPQTGTCCPSVDTCGQSCCDSTESCLNQATSTCCTKGKECGSTCCGNSETIGFDCENPTLGLCCPTGRGCGTMCCARGQVCIAAGQCDPDPRGYCFPEAPCTTDADCDPHFEFCDTNAGAPSGGCCTEVIR